MAGFILIHGAMHGGWCFDAVADILRAKGHSVAAPDLPGMGGDEETLRTTTLDDWTAFLVGELRAMRAMIGDAPLVLAGHSRGGINISAAAEAAPELIDALVYITALMAPSGMSGHTLFASLPRDERMEALLATRAANDGPIVFDADAAIPLFAQCTPPAIARAAMSRLVAEPMGSFGAETRLTPERFGAIPRTYIECLQDRALPIVRQRAMQEMVPGARVVTLDADHSPFLCMPQELAHALLDAAAKR